jgi:hypothetical protein
MRSRNPKNNNMEITIINAKIITPTNILSFSSILDYRTQAKAVDDKSVTVDELILFFSE